MFTVPEKTSEKDRSSNHLKAKKQEKAIKNRNELQ